MNRTMTAPATLSPEQQDLRRSRVTSSDIAAIAGLNPFRTVIDPWLEKTGRVEPGPVTIQQEAGQYLEPAIASWYADKFHCELVRPETIIHPTEDWMAATPDRFVVQAGEIVRIVEIKAVGYRIVHHWSDGCPEYVTAQVAWQQLVTGIHAEANVAAMVGGTDWRVEPISWDPDIAQALQEVGREFLEYVRKDRQPPIDASAAWKRYLSEKWRGGLDPMREDDGEGERWAMAYLAALDDEKISEERKKEAANHLRDIIGDAAGIYGHFGEAAGLYGRDWRATWKRGKNGNRTLRVTSR